MMLCRSFASVGSRRFFIAKNRTRRKAMLLKRLKDADSISSKLKTATAAAASVVPEPALKAKPGPDKNKKKLATATAAATSVVPEPALKAKPGPDKNKKKLETATAAATSVVPEPALKAKPGPGKNKKKLVDGGGGGAAAAGKLTPAMAQFFRLKQQHPGFLMLFRLGDFYETFFEDAELASRLLGLALAKRRQKSGDIPMAGIPAHSLEGYLQRLLAQGVRVAVCDQVEDASQAQAQKRLVRRAVTRLVTAGTLYEDGFLDPKQANLLCAVAARGDTTALAHVDLSTGDFVISSQSAAGGALADELARLQPRELLVAQSSTPSPSSTASASSSPPPEFLQSLMPSVVVTNVDKNMFDQVRGSTCIEQYCSGNNDQLGTTTSTSSSSSSSSGPSFSPLELQCAGALFNYALKSLCPPVAAAAAANEQEEEAVSSVTGRRRLQFKLAYPRRTASSSFMWIDASTRRHLELTEPLTGSSGSGNSRLAASATLLSSASLFLSSQRQSSRTSCLLDVLDQTVTAAGARMLRERLAAPLLDQAEINRRLDLVEFFYGAVDRCAAADAVDDPVADLRRALSGCYDLPRTLQRLQLGRGSPKDLAHIALTLDSAEKAGQSLFHLLNEETGPGKQQRTNNNKSLARNRRQAVRRQKKTADSRGGGGGGGGGDAVLFTFAQLMCDLVEPLGRELEAALTEPLNHVRASLTDGHFIRRGYNAELDGLRQLELGAPDHLDQVQSRYAEQLGVRLLKVKRTELLGFFVEIPSPSVDRVPRDWLHVQTLRHTMRFRTAELQTLQAKVDGAASRAFAIERQLFQGLVDHVLRLAGPLQELAHALASVDVACALAKSAHDHQWTRPELLAPDDEPGLFHVEAGRHPVVAAALRQHQQHQGLSFTPNDCRLSTDDRCVAMITGPNMGGKSTFLRQNALIAVMAQMGSFVSADRCRLSAVDAVFSRVGAADDLAGGSSTFMVEMRETARILTNSSRRSLVIVDELGRGTAAIEGRAIAQSVLEYLCSDQHRTRCLFATHYHELARLVVSPRLQQFFMDSRETDSGLAFLHAVRPGTSETSHALHVAQLAGIPQPVIDRAQQILHDETSSSLLRGGAVK